MSSSASLPLAALLALLMAAARPLPAQAPAGAGVPGSLARAVAGAVAAQWSADSTRVRLEWGPVPSAAALGPATPFRLMGKGTDGWFVAVFEPAAGSPAAVRVRAGVLDTVPVAARALGSGVTLAATDIRRDARVQWGAPADSAITPGEGWLTRRPLAAGDVLSATTVTPPQLVRAGEAVRLEWHRGGVAIGLDGVALGPGALGQTVRVRLAERGGQRSGRVVGPNAVRLDS